MPAPDRLGRILRGWRADAVVAAALAACLIGILAVQGYLHGARSLLASGCAVGILGCVVARRPYPRLAALVAAGLLAAISVASAAMPSDLPGDVMLVPVFMLAYALGADANFMWSAAILLVLGAGLQLAAGPAVFNPFVVVITIGPWALGLVVSSRRRVTEQLAARGRELEAERALFAAEAVRYERARIARELHDIVAHCVSVMVIQASAGQRLTATDPSLAAEAFDAIGDAARQAGAEIGRLVEMLDHDSRQKSADGLRLVGELVARAGAAGLAVSCRFSGSADGLPASAADAAYRVVQESLTNALKHAPGSPVEIVIAAAAAQVEIGVVNGPAAGPPSGLELSGGGRGLAGMRERVTACGGEVSAGPVDGGGWQVLARLPRQPAHVRAGSLS
jgi:signal transduction histidine kinase